MLENLSIGLDIATALSVIAAAGAFIWNSVVSRRKERNERKKEIIKSHVFKAAEKIIQESTPLLNETKRIEKQVRDGVTTMNLEPWKELVFQLPASFKWLEPLDKVYADGRFMKLTEDFEKELNEFILYFAQLVSPDSEEEWDFYIIYKPIEITTKYVTRLYQETEDYFADL